MIPYYERGGIRLYVGDCREVVPTLDGIGAVCTDPPYGLGFMGRDWDHAVPGEPFWRTFSDAMLPGAHLLSFGGSRTFHRIAVAIEDAGFEIRDTLMWMYGSGFPKSLDVSKAIDKLNGRKFEDRYALGQHIRERREEMGLSRVEVNSWFGYRDGCEHWERQDPHGARVPTLADWHILCERLQLSDVWLPLIERVEAERAVIGRDRNWGQSSESTPNAPNGEWDITAPATPEAEQWQGWGTALKPAWEPIILARKPMAGTVASNVLAHGTGAINIDACRVSADGNTTRDRAPGDRSREHYRTGTTTGPHYPTTQGRWPANVILDEDAAALLDQQSGVSKSTGGQASLGAFRNGDVYGRGKDIREHRDPGYGDTGGASRYFKVVAQDCFSTYNVEEQEDAPCGDGLTRDESTSAGKRTENSVDNLHIDGSGNRQTDLFQTGTKSTTSTATRSTTNSAISNSSPQSGTTTTTSDSAKITESSTALNTDDASGAASTSRSTDSSGARQEPIKGTAKTASANTSESGERRTESTTTPICARIESASEPINRFYYVAKASRAERNRGLEGMPERDKRNAYGDGLNSATKIRTDDQRENGVNRGTTQNHHPTVKPLALMRWLLTLVTPPDGIVLDPFAGSGSTLVAAAELGIAATGIEMSEAYAEIAARRIDAVLSRDRQSTLPLGVS